MNNRELLKRNKQLYEANWSLEAELEKRKNEILLLNKKLVKLDGALNVRIEEGKEDYNEICKLKDKIYDLQADKDKCIEFIKKQRCMLMHAEDEIARLNDENTNLKQNISALGVTLQENDQAYYKLVEANAFLAGKVQAYENVSRSESEPDPDAAETAH